MTDQPGQSWQPIDLSTVERLPAVRPTMAGNLFYPGGRHLLSGEPESGKSWLALHWCVEQIRAGAYVVWIDFETDPRFMAERLRCLGVTDEELRRFTYLQPWEPVTSRGVAEVIAWILETYKPTVVVFDAFAGLLDLHGLDSNKAMDIERGYRTIVEPWRKDGAATGVIDHVVKNTESRGRFTTGSERKLGAVDVHIGLRLSEPFGRGREGKAKVTIHKDRSGFLPRPLFGYFSMASDEEGVVSRIEVLEGEDDFKPTHLMQKVSAYLEREGERSRNQIETEVEGKAEYVRKAIDLLVLEECISERKGERNARLFASIKPYLEPKEWVPIVRDEVVPEKQGEFPW